MGDYIGDYYRIPQGNARSLDYGSFDAVSTLKTKQKSLIQQFGATKGAEYIVFDFQVLGRQTPTPRMRLSFLMMPPTPHLQSLSL